MWTRPTRLAILAATALLAQSAAPVAAQALSSEPLGDLEFADPAQEPQSTVHVAVAAPDARGPLYLAGTFNDWRPDDPEWKLERAAGEAPNTWVIEVSARRVGPTQAEFKVTRGSWREVEVNADLSDRPNREWIVKEGPVLLNVAGWADDRKGPLIPKSTVTGRLDIFDVGSKSLGKARTVRVWLPANYEKAEQQYPVLYMHDGQNVFDAATSAQGVEWGADETLTQLVADGRVPAHIVVGIDNGRSRRTSEYNPPFTNTRGVANTGDRYLDFLTRELMPLIEERYRVETGPENTALGGSSFGGNITLYAALRHPNTFGALLVESPAAWTHGGALLERCAAQREWPARVFVAIGTKESARETYQAGYARTIEVLRESLRASGLGEERARFRVVEGAVHSESAWAERLPSALEFLLARE